MFSQRGNFVKPLFVHYSFSNLSIKVSYLAYRYTKRLTEWHPKVITSDVKQHIFGQSLHCMLIRATAFSIWGPQKNSSYP